MAKHIACLCNCEAPSTLTLHLHLKNHLLASLIPAQSRPSKALARMKRGDMEAAACMLERAWEARPRFRCVSLALLAGASTAYVLFPAAVGAGDGFDTVGPDIPQARSAPARTLRGYPEPHNPNARAAVDTVRGITMNNKASIRLRTVPEGPTLDPGPNPAGHAVPRKRGL